MLFLAVLLSARLAELRYAHRLGVGEMKNTVCCERAAKEMDKQARAGVGKGRADACAATVAPLAIPTSSLFLRRRGELSLLCLMTPVPGDRPSKSPSSTQAPVTQGRVVL